MNIYNRINELINQDREMVIATIVDAMGSAPGRQSFRMIILKDGSLEGTVGGGALEYLVVEKARACMEKASSAFEEVNLEKIGMDCGGSVKIFFEYIPCQKQLYIFGGGHICQALTPLAADLGFEVTVVDNREEIARPGLHRGAREVVHGDFGATIQSMHFRAPAWALVVSHRHGHDEEILRELLLRDLSFRYIGMIGSRKKVLGTFDRIKAAGVKEEKLTAVYSPVGLDIGADTPHEIAIAILAEIIALERNRAVPHMRMQKAGNQGGTH